MKAMSITSKTKIPLSQKLKEDFDSLKKHTGTSVREYIGFGNISYDALKYFKHWYGDHNIGEMNSENKLRGRGVRIYPGGDISIQYWNNGDDAPGNYIYICSDGSFEVGERYMKYG